MLFIFLIYPIITKKMHPITR